MVQFHILPVFTAMLGVSSSLVPLAPKRGWAWVDELCWSNYQTEIHGFTSRTSEASDSGKKQTVFRDKQTCFAPYICHIAIVF